jgi:hypothetical protein
MKKYVVIKTSFSATHSWKKAKNYLKYEHRHVFYITMKWEVSHNDREIEFIKKKWQVDLFIKINYLDHYLENTSCEDIAETLMKTFKAVYVSVFEDDENGAEIIKE